LALSAPTTFETRLDVFPGGLIVRMGFEVGEAGVENSSLFWSDRDVGLEQSVPQCSDELEAIFGRQLERIFEQLIPIS